MNLDAVQRAARASLDSSPLVEGREGEAVVGGIVVASCSSGQRRIVGIAARHEITQTMWIHLMTNILESATDLDLIIRSAESGIPFDLAVQGELYGPIFAEQVSATLGSIEPTVIAAAGSALSSDGESLSGHETGLPLGDESDPRRAFKELELQELEALVGECRNWLAGGPAHERILDPELLLPPPTGTPYEVAEDQFLELLDVLERMPASVPAELFALIDEEELMDEMFRWQRDFGMGLDIGRLLTQGMGMAERALRLDLQIETEDRVSEGRRSDVILARYVNALAEAGEPVLDVETTTRCWNSPEEVTVLRIHGERYCRVRAQMVEAA